MYIRFPIAITHYTFPPHSQTRCGPAHQSSTIVPNHNGNEGTLLLVVVIRDWNGGQFWTAEYSLDAETLKPSRVSEPAMAPTTDEDGNAYVIQTQYPFVHTGLDGRALHIILWEAGWKHLSLQHGAEHLRWRQ